MKAVTPFRRRRNFRTFAAAFLSYLMLVGQVAPLALAAARPNSAAPPKVEAKVAAGGGETQRAAAAPAPVAFTAPNITATMTSAVTTDADADGKADPGDTITYTVNVTNNGTADATNVQFNDTVDVHTTPVSGSALVAASDSYTTIGDVKITVPANQGLLANDFNPDTGNNTGLTATAETKSSANCASCNNVTINADGSFTFDPKVGDTTADSFTYTVNSAGGSATATVKITITGKIWFVNNNAGACPGAPCDGRLSHPFTTLASFQAANDGGAGHPAAGDSIFVYESATNYVGPVTLLANQKFIGQDASASLATITGLTQPSGTDPLPAMNATPATIVNITSAANAINLGTGNLLRGFTVGATTGAKISGTSFGTLIAGNNTTPDVTLNGAGQALSLTTGAFDATSGFVSVATTSSTAQGINLSGITGAVNFGSTTVSGSTTQGILIGTTTADINFGNTSIGTASANSGGTDALSFQNNSNAGHVLTFGSLSISNNSNEGFVHAVGGGAVTVTGATTITHPGTTGMDIQGSNANLTFNGVGIDKSATAGTGVSISGTNTGKTFNFGSLSITTSNGTALLASSTGGTIVTSGGTISATGGSAIDASGIAFNNGSSLTSASASGGVVSGITLTNVTGSMSVGAGGTLTGNASAPTFAVSGGTVAFTYSGSITQAANAAAVSISGGHATGAITFQTGTVSATSGTGLQFDNADGTYNFNGTTTLNGGNAGVDILNGSSGTFSFSSNTGITSPSGTAFNVNASNPSVTYSGSITQNTSGQRVVNIDTTSSNTITFNTGTITGGASSTGVNINAANGNVSFANLNLGTSGARMTNQAVTITGGTGTYSLGTVSIFTSGAAAGIVATNADGTLNTTGTVDASGATAINISGPAGLTTLGMTLTKISSGGGVNGISIQNTSGSFTVNGDGTNNASGGLIQNSTGDGVLLANASNISLTSMSIQSSAHSGVKGSNNVQNFSFVNGTINNSGTASGTGDSNIAFNKGEFAPTVGNEKNLTGTLTVTGSTLTNAFFNGVDVYQFDGTVSNFNISNNTITSSTSTATSKGDGIKLVGFGSGSTVANYSKGTINANTISNFPSDAGIFFAGGNGTSAAAPAGTYGSDISTNAIKITNNTIAGQSAAAGIGTQGIFTSLNGTGTGFFNITSNSITNVLGIAIATGANGNTTYNGIILSNTINAHNINNSAGIGGGTTNTFGTSDTPTYNAKIGDGTVAGANNISNTFGNGILINSINGVGHTNVRILKNTVAVPIESPPSGTVYGIRVAEGNINSSGDSICLDISANTTAGNDDGAGTHAPGIGLRRQNGTAQVFGIVGMAATSSPGVENFVNGQNPGSASGSFGVGGTALISATTGFSNCSEPAVLALNTSQTNGGETLAQERDAFRNGASAVAFFAPTDDHNASAQTAQTSNASFDGLFSAAVSAASTVSAAAPVEAQTAAASGPAPREWSDIHAAPVERAAQQSDAVYSDDSGSSREGVRVVNASYEPSGDAAAQRSHTSRHVKARAAGVAAAAFATCAPSGFSGGHLCADLGTIKQGDSVQITFKVTLNNPPNLDAPDLSGGAHVSNQGTVSGTGFASVPTDDPSVGGATDPTKTPVDLFHSQTTLASDHPGSANNGDTVTFTATVSLAPATSPTPATPTTPSGTVTFKSDGNPISPACTNVPLSGGQAQCQTSALTPAGSPHSITAFYSGDGNFNPSDNTGSPLSQTIIACLTTATVNTTADPTGAGGTTSLRDAVTNLCTNGTINFDTAAGHAFDPATAPHTIQLASALPDIAKNMTITGPGAKVLSVVGSQVNGNSYRVFNVTNAATNVNISGLTITGGRDDTGGGDIQNAGTLNVSDSAVTFGNSATLGGGINNSGTLTVTRSAITNNTTAAGGGGISNTGTLTVKDSTISTNTANTGGNGGGVLNNSVANIVNFINDTITANSANGSGGGLFNASGTFQIVNTIVAGNTATVAGPDVSGTFTSQGHNLVGQSDGSTGFGATGDLVGSTATPLDPKLGALTNNGGPTQTHALLPNSPAIEAGDNTAATNAGLTTDQRGTGFPRIADSADADAIQTVDIGAFELHPSIEDITDKTTAEDTSLSFTFNLGDATGSGSPLITSVVGTSSNQTLVPDANISVTSAASDSMRTLNITPAANANSPADGTATITVTVTATNGQTATDTFVLTVTEVNDPPTAVNDTVPDILEDSGTYSIPISTLLANDLKGPANESGQTLSIIGVSNPTGGSVAINGSNVDFSPTLNFNGTAGFDYTITDNGTTNGNPDPKTSTAHVTFNITAVNDAPSFTKGADQTVAEDAGAQTVNNWATAISPGPADESSQIVNFIVTNDNNALFSAQPAVSSTGTLTYTPAANKFGQATVSVSLHDNGG
ncbi:MAG TPA: Ig-like domain-containing protein, partial [Pyrinomonadaceae bacterium]|nr:Ig-like domain-containing protein [Pyrinomonadaceae bacterium]